MTTTLSQISPPRPGTSVSNTRAEFSESAAPRTLSQAVQQAVRWVDDSVLRRVAPSNAGPGFEPRTLLAVMTYCYAREIYSSIDIEELIRTDQPFRQLCQNEY